MSSTKFAPGNKSIAKKMMKHLEKNQLCSCADTKYNKFVIGSDSPSTRMSNNRRISQIINYSKGGKSHYGNFYLGQPLSLNYLGRVEGMPGGGGSPPSNF